MNDVFYVWPNQAWRNKQITQSREKKSIKYAEKLTQYCLTSKDGNETRRKGVNQTQPWPRYTLLPPLIYKPQQKSAEFKAISVVQHQINIIRKDAFRFFLVKIGSAS